MKKWSATAVKILLLSLPLLLPILVSNTYYVHGILNQILVFSILILSLDVLMGDIGDVSLGHAGLFAVGAYTVAILTATPGLNSSSESTLSFFPQLPFLSALALGIGLTVVVGCLFAIPSLRLSGDYLAVTTLAFGLIIHTVINEMEMLTNGTKGIQTPPIDFLGIQWVDNQFLWLVYPLLLGSIFIVTRVRKSHWGLAFSAIRMSSIAAESCGVWRSGFKIFAFALSAALAGLAGGLFAKLNNYVGPNTFSLDLSILCVIVLIFGGLRSVFGNIVGMATFIFLPDLLNALRDYRLATFGLLLLIFLFLVPGGVASLVRRALIKIETTKFKFLVDFFARPASTFAFSEAKLTGQKSDSRIQDLETRNNGSMELSNITVAFGGVKALEKVSFLVEPGTIHGLIGPNGSGKSTLMNVISGLVNPLGGKILVNGVELQKQKVHRRAVLGVRRTFQNLQLIPEASAIENVLLGFHSQIEGSLFQILFRTQSYRLQLEKSRHWACHWMREVGLAEEKFLRPAGELSYGESRRLELARALMSNPKVLLLDEPAAGFGDEEQSELANLLLRLKKNGQTILIIEHHMSFLYKICDRLTVLNLGKVIADGAMESVRSNPEVRKAYLGDSVEVSA